MRIVFAMIAGCLIAVSPQASAQEKNQLDRAVHERIVKRAIDFLAVKGQAKDGSYTKAAGIGPTAIITTSLIQHGRSINDPQVARSLKFLEEHVRKDGGIYQPGTFFRNYESCLSLMCFAAAKKQATGAEKKKYEKLIARADRFIKGIQWAEDSGKTRSDVEYGGGGYGRHKRPDLSNTSILVDALKAAGNKEDGEAIKRALVFISRCQNLESPHNTTKFSAKINDGGFYYTPAGGGSSPAGTEANGGLRSYGAMTYAGLKSMIYAGVNKNDPRIKAANKWIKRHYRVDENPGLGSAGLYYYFHVFAKALDALGEEVIVDAKGQRHHWRSELVRELAKRQRPDGSWANKNRRWLESDPNLATGFALMALTYCKPKNSTK